MAIDTLKKYRHIIWDWNGTLLDDVDIAVSAMNCLLKRRKMPVLDTGRYKDIFTFPVKDYYSRLGFDFEVETFDALAIEYINEFNSDTNHFRLQNGALEVLNAVKAVGIGQSILSASHESSLYEIIAKMDIKDYFFRIAGLNNHYALSKVRRGEELINELGLKPESILLIGDTAHDFEVAEALGCRCLLVSSGHQSYNRLYGCNTEIIQNISELIGFEAGEAIA